MLSEYYEKTKPYSLWFLIPLTAIYLLDMVEFLAIFGKTVLGCAIVVLLSGLIYGAWLAVSESLYQRPPIKFRFHTVIPTVNWSYELFKWLLEQEKDSGDNQD